MKTYAKPAVLYVILTEEHTPSKEPDFNPESIRILERTRHPLYHEDLKQFQKQQLAETFSFKRKGFRKHQK